MKQVEAIQEGSGNVFEDLGFDATEAASLKIRADLMLDLRDYILRERLTTSKAADLFSTSSSVIEDLMSGEIGSFDIETLINMLTLAGKNVKIEILPSAA